MSRLPGKPRRLFLPPLFLALVAGLPVLRGAAQEEGAAAEASEKDLPPCLKDGMAYTYRVTDKAWSEEPFELVVTVREQDRLGERFFRVDTSSTIDKLETRGVVVLRGRDGSLVECQLERRGRKDKETIERTHRVTFQETTYQYQKDGKAYGAPRDLVQDFLLPGDAWFFFLTLLTREEVMPRKSAEVDLDDCRSRPVTFVVGDPVELDAGPLKKVSCGILVKRTAEKEYWAYARDEDGLVVRVWPTEDFEVVIDSVEDRLEKVRPAFAKGLEYLAEGDSRKAEREFKKVLRVKEDFGMVVQARAHLRALEDQ